MGARSRRKGRRCEREYARLLCGALDVDGWSIRLFADGSYRGSLRRSTSSRVTTACSGKAGLQAYAGRVVSPLSSPGRAVLRALDERVHDVGEEFGIGRGHQLLDDAEDHLNPLHAPLGVVDLRALGVALERPHG